MALLAVDFFSEVLEMGTSMTVLLPQAPGPAEGPAPRLPREMPVLYLLHGLSDDRTGWLRHTSLERYLWERPMAVVMPQVGRSFYADEAHGHRYWTFLSEELPEVAQGFFRLSARREDTFVAGLSMGGYGALKWALRQPERFAAAASLSGALDVVALSRQPERSDLFERVFGGPPGPDDDLLDLLGRTPPASLPRLRVACGTEDPLYAANMTFLDRARALGVEVAADLRPGAHEWDLWDAGIRDVLAWLPR